MIAVLRVRFDTNPDPTTVWSDAHFHGWLDPNIFYSLAHYWKTASLGAFDLRYVLFPTLVIPDPRVGAPPGSGNGVIRPRLIDGVLAGAYSQFGFDVEPFDQLLLWFAQPTDMFGMESYPAPRYFKLPKPVGVSVVDVSSPFDSVCQEVGHSFGLDHPIGVHRPPDYQGSSDLEYGSPYDVMASQAYLGFASSFVRGQDARLPDGGPQGYQRVIGPLLSGAQLTTLVPWLALTPYATTISAPSSTGTRLRLHALDQAAAMSNGWGQHPFVALVHSVVGQTYSIELRRGRGYDSAIGTPAPGVNRPPAGLVVHHRHPASGRIFYDGVLPLPPAGGDLDWRSWTGRFVIRVRQVADDLSWADIVVGGQDFWRQWHVDVDIRSDSQREQVVERRSVDVDIPCVSGTYSVEKVEREYETVLAATSYGFERPGYTWWVNGSALQATATADTVTFLTMVSTPDPDPRSKGGTVSVQAVSLLYTLVGSRLTLWSGSQPGNFGCEVSISASETDPGASKSLVPTVSDAVRLEFRCLRYQWEDAYERAFERCFDFGTRFQELEDLRVRIDPGDPPPYAVRPEELEGVLRLEVLAAAQREDRGRAEVVDYLVHRYLIPEEQIQARIDRRN